MALLEVRHLTKEFSRREGLFGKTTSLRAVDDVSFTVRPGEVVGYLGPNGSGKSTTVKIITTLIEPTDGRVLLDGRDIRADPIGFKRRLGYVPEQPSISLEYASDDYALAQFALALGRADLHAPDRPGGTTTGARPAR